MLLGLVLGFVALFHQDHQDDRPSTNQLPPIPAEALGFDNRVGPSISPAQQQQQSAESASNTTTALSNTTILGAAGVGDRDGSTNDAQPSPPSLFSALASMAVAGAAGGKQQQQQQGMSPKAEAEAEEGGGFLSVVGCTPEDGEELRAMVEGAWL